MKKKFIFIIIILIFTSLILTFILWNRDEENKESTEKTDQVEQIIETTTQEEEEEELTIISPEGDTFYANQARMYNALIENNHKYQGKKVECSWKFFLNENNQESLYQEMENSSILSDVSQKICGFTSTFIENKGVLRVTLTIQIVSPTGENLENITVKEDKVYNVI